MTNEKSIITHEGLEGHEFIADFRSRRALLKGLGLGAMFFSPLVRSLSAQTAGVAEPKLIIFYTPNGFYHAKQTMRRSGTGANPDLPVFADSLTPLNKHAANLLALKNIASTNISNEAENGGHEYAAALLTGTPSVKLNGDRLKQNARAASIDWVIAQRFAQDPLGLGAGYWSSQWKVFWRGAGQPNDPINDIRGQLATLFPAMPATAPVPNQTADQAKAQRCKVVHDALLQDAKTLTARLSGEDKTRVEPYLQALEEMRCAAVAPAATPAPVAQCVKPNPPALDYNKDLNFRNIIMSHLDVIIPAFRCGYRRVATIAIPGTAGFGPYLANPGELDHHGVSHYKGIGGGANDPAKAQAQDTAAAQLFSDMLDKLQAGGVLKDCAVLWVSEIVDGQDHSSADRHVFLAGGGAGKLRTGRFIRFEGADADRSLNRVCTTLANLMGHSLVRFGDAGRATDGPIPGLLV